MIFLQIGSSCAEQHMVFNIIMLAQLQTRITGVIHSRTHVHTHTHTTKPHIKAFRLWVVWQFKVARLARLQDYMLCVAFGVCFAPVSCAAETLVLQAVYRNLLSLVCDILDLLLITVFEGRVSRFD